MEHNIEMTHINHLESNCLYERQQQQRMYRFGTRAERERARALAEEEDAAFGRSLWTSGVAANTANLERFIGYTVDQGLIDAPLAVTDLFHPSVRDT